MPIVVNNPEAGSFPRSNLKVAQRIAGAVRGEVVLIDDLREEVPAGEPVFVVGGDGSVSHVAEKAAAVILVGRGSRNRIRKELIHDRNVVGLGEFIDNWAAIVSNGRFLNVGLVEGESLEFVRGRKTASQGKIEKRLQFYTNVQQGLAADWIHLNVNAKARKQVPALLAHAYADVSVLRSEARLDLYYCNAMGSGVKLWGERLQRGEGKVVHVRVESGDKAGLLAKYFMLRLASQKGSVGSRAVSIDCGESFPIDFGEGGRLCLDGEAVWGQGKATVSAVDRMVLMVALKPGWEFERIKD